MTQNIHSPKLEILYQESLELLLGLLKICYENLKSCWKLRNFWILIQIKTWSIWKPCVGDKS